MKKNILIIYNYVLHYRIPFFNKLGEKYNVTVLHSGNETKAYNTKFIEITSPVKHFGPFKFQKNVITEIKKEQYDIVIVLFDVAWINTLLAFLMFSKHKKIILWGPWITRSNIANTIRTFFIKRAFATVFYTDEARQSFIKKGVSSNTLYVGNNTFDVGIPEHSYLYASKFRILFVGSLDKRKQNNVLINAFSSILEKISENIHLTIIGEGEEQNIIESQIKEKNITNRVSLVGKLNDKNVLNLYYREAIVSVSFGQAGLSVLQSMGYGVPFLTKKNAISGGEKSNIIHKQNGLLCEDSEMSLARYLLEVCSDIEWAKALGKNAFDHYQRYCTIENMTNGFIDAIEGTKNAVIYEYNVPKNDI